MRMMVEDGEVPILTCWGLLVRKSLIHRQREVLSCNVCSLLMSWLGLMELNAKLKSTNSILMYVLGFSMWLRAVWRAMEMAWSVDLLDL